MEYFAEVIKIIEAGVRVDVQKLVDYSELLSSKLAKDGENRKSERIKKVLSERGFAQNVPQGANVHGMAAEVSQVPFDKESHLELADVFLPSQIHAKTVIMSSSNECQLRDFINSYRHRDDLSAHGLDAPATLLLFGPPGCGKTETAMQLAKQLNLPIVVARLDTMISSFLGSTAKNIRRLFDYASKTPCLLFLDEFDAVAKIRDDPHEMGELKRVVNSLLQNLDGLDGRSVLVAATNHDKLLDEAIWRRFSTRINIPLPSPQLASETIKQVLEESDAAIETKAFDFLVHLLVGESIADIQQILKRALRKSVIERRDITAADFVRSYFEYTRNDFNRDNDDELTRQEKLKYLRSIDRDISFRFLGEVLNCHHSTIKRDLEKISLQLRGEC